MEIGNFQDLTSFRKLELKLKVGRRTSNSRQPTWGAFSGGVQLSRDVSELFSLLSLFKLPRTSLKLR